MQKKKLWYYKFVYEARHSLAVCLTSLNQSHLLGYLAWLFWLFRELNPNDGEAGFECIFLPSTNSLFNFSDQERAEAENWGREEGAKAT